MAKIFQCYGEVAYCVMEKFVIALSVFTLIFAIAALISLTHKKPLSVCGGVAILIWLVGLMNLISFVHYSFATIQYYNFTLGFRQFFRGILYIWTYLYFGQICRQFTQWPYKIKLVLYISSGIACLAFVAELIPRLAISTYDKNDKICEESFWLAFQSVRLVVILFFMGVLLIAQKSVNRAHPQNIFDEMELMKRKDLFWRLWVIVGAEIFVSVFEEIFDIIIQASIPLQGSCEFPMSTVAGNAAFYLIFRIITLFLTDWVVLIVLLVKRKDELPDSTKTTNTVFVDRPIEQWGVQYQGLNESK